MKIQINTGKEDNTLPTRNQVKCVVSNHIEEVRGSILTFFYVQQLLLKRTKQKRTMTMVLITT